MKITRKQFEQAIEEVEISKGELGTGGNRRILVQHIAEKWNIEVEPEPLLPGVSGGEWECGEPYRYKGPGSKLVCDIPDVARYLKPADAKLMAASKEMAEIFGDMLEAEVKLSPDYWYRIKGVLEKAGAKLEEVIASETSVAHK
jgi:hypothetical protein